MDGNTLLILSIFKDAPRNPIAVREVQSQLYHNKGVNIALQTIYNIVAALEVIGELQHVICRNNTNRVPIKKFYYEPKQQ